LRNILFVCLDSARYDTFEASNARNMKAMGDLKKVHSVAACTVPSMVAYLSGFPPIGAGRKDLFRRGDPGRYLWAPKFFSDLGWATAWISSNPALLHLDGGIAGGFSRFFKYFESMKYIKSPFRGQRSYTDQIVADLEKIMALEKRSVFMCILSMDTHRPYNFAEGCCDIDPEDPEKNFINQVKAIEYFDSFFPRIVDQFRGRGETDVIITSDHGELFGPVYWSHDPTTPFLEFDEKLFEIPFIVGEFS